MGLGKTEHKGKGNVWGIGLLAHGLSVFVPNWIMGQNWEDRKIKEFIEKEKANKWE